MLQTDIYNSKGETVSKGTLPEAVFNVSVNPVLVHQCVVAQRANARQVLAHTKDRSEVRGGGKKPWRQKGTGRARHGSIRSPLWIGGGVTFGPRKNRNFSVKLNRKMKKKALCMVLSDKAQNSGVLLADVIDFGTAKTKDMTDFIGKLPVGRKVMIVLEKQNTSVWKSAANLPNVQVILANSLNIVDTLSADTIIVEQNALPIIEATYALTASDATDSSSKEKAKS